MEYDIEKATLTVSYDTDAGEKRVLDLSVPEARALAVSLRLGLRLVADAKQHGVRPTV